MTDQVERSRFIAELLGEVDAFDASLNTCTDPVKKGENVVGELSPWLRKVYALWRYYSKQSRLMIVDRELEDSHAAASDPEVGPMVLKASMLKDVLWYCSRLELNQAGANTIGVRENWQVVVYEEEDDDPFKQIMGFMLGRKPR